MEAVLFILGIGGFLWGSVWLEGKIGSMTRCQYCARFLRADLHAKDLCCRLCENTEMRYLTMRML